MKLQILFALLASASAFQVAPVAKPSTSLEAETSRRAAFAGIVAGVVAPAAAFASAGESPKFSVFGIIGDGGALSEGGAYGSDQPGRGKVYSPYSVYSESGADAKWNQEGGYNGPEYIARKKAVLAETKVRLAKLPAYIEKKKWYEVKNELTRYMYETRGACTFLSKDNLERKEAQVEFFKAIEKITLNATLKNQEACQAAQEESLVKLDAFLKLV
ncbi:hypothetical protein TrVE_jg2317 [Triparma verrucosa]|uniref:Uncharacterized protein n=2 Tax=Triparma TaxID=722752 RepID=A0A9W6ZV20_9STRA|nr:hypothetical protein TrST_g364 [Triparma strigata]GMI13607.1 hypothetical protein TrVE_jg2317 [Triparma verrucosa]